MPFFTPPTVDDVPPVTARRDPLYPVVPNATRLFRHFKPRARGRTVLKLSDGGGYVAVDNPTSDQIDAADAHYLGGHVYEVDGATAAELAAAGFGGGLS